MNIFRSSTFRDGGIFHLIKKKKIRNKEKNMKQCNVSAWLSFMISHEFIMFEYKKRETKDFNEFY